MFVIVARAGAAVVWTGPTLGIVLEVHRLARSARRSSIVRLAAVAWNLLNAQIALSCVSAR